MSEEKSDKKKVVGASAKPDHSSEEETVDLRDDSHIDIKPSDDSLRCSQKGFRERWYWPIGHADRYGDQSKLTMENY